MTAKKNSASSVDYRIQTLIRARGRDCVVVPADVLQQLTRYDDLHGRMVTVRAGDRIITGRGEGFSTRGELLLRTPTGQESVLSGTVMTVDGQDVRSAN